MAVGIDIGSKTVKMIELTKNGQNWELKGSGIIGYKGAAPDKAVDERELVALGDVIRKLHKEANMFAFLSLNNLFLPEQSSSLFLRIRKLPQPLNGKRNNIFPFQFPKRLFNIRFWKEEKPLLPLRWLSF